MNIRSMERMNYFSVILIFGGMIGTVIDMPYSRPIWMAGMILSISSFVFIVIMAVMENGKCIPVEKIIKANLERSARDKYVDFDEGNLPTDEGNLTTDEEFIMEPITLAELRGEAPEKGEL